MKRTTIITLAAMLGLALAGAIPALAQEQEGPTPAADACPYHNGTDMPHDDMESWMGSNAHGQWMQSTEQSRMHESMEESPGIMNGNSMMNGRGSMTDSGSMMGASG